MGGTLSFDIEGENPQHSYHKNSSFGFYFGAISGWSSYVACLQNNFHFFFFFKKENYIVFFSFLFNNSCS